MRQDDPKPFEILVLNPAAWNTPAAAVSAARAGATGLLDLEGCRDAARAGENFRQLLKAASGRVGLRLTAEQLPLARELRQLAGARPLTWLLYGEPQLLADLARAGDTTLLEVTDDRAELEGAVLNGIVVKGSEAARWSGEDSSFILAQKWLAVTQLPVYVRGGVGLNSAAAIVAGGGSGMVLDDQLLLLEESPLSQAQKNELARLNGSETRLLGEALGTPCRVYARPGSSVLKSAEAETRAAEAGELSVGEWRERLSARIGWSEDELLPVGQGIGVAAAYRERYGRVARLILALRERARSQAREAARLAALGPEGALAQSHGTHYPLVQGPMTRVSDHPGFAAAVAEAGALPMLALALMRGDQVLELLRETKQRLGDRPWGVGLLGFVPQALRDEQCEAIWQCAPPFALIAGGRPDQAHEFERRGIATYIHAPAPELLRLYLEQGSTRFVFEGRECGGHVGPIASFPLWEQMVEVLLREVKPGSESAIHLLFAGGISDARSAAMLAALTAPLAARGMKVGALLGTAYLFTEEIVSSGAVVRGFQQEALACSQTACLESGPGHSTRCAVTGFANEFSQRRRELLRAKLPLEEVRDQLEELNLGRLRIASKGLERNAAGSIQSVAEPRQHAEGMYMIGQVATLTYRVRPVAELHEDICAGAQQMLQRLSAASADAAEKLKPSDIAIVGIGCLLPKATDAEAYWNNVLHQVNVISEIPRSRFDWRLYFDADRDARDKIYSKWGGFLDELPFDPTRYGIAPASMKSIDPMQLLALETARRALIDAGYADGHIDSALDRERTAVIFGSGGGVGDLGMQYGVRSELPRFVAAPDAEAWNRLPEWTNESFAGTLQNVAAGRIANRLDLGGVNFTIDAACASSLAAVAAAVQELESGRSSIAIAGGVDTVQGPHGFMCFSKTQALSADGKTRTFDRDANGIVISEGAAVVVLKRLADAEAHGDRIYAVIKSVAGSSDGRALGMTAPRPDGQIRALDRAYAKAGFTPASLDLIEAHGTGTPVGDRAEAETVTRVLRSHEAAPRSTAIGSVKTILGHTKCVAGLVGMAKMALALRHRVLPAHAGVEKPLEPLADPLSPVYLLKSPRPWLERADGTPRRAAVSAFGFGGTNFHAVLEEYRDGVVHAEPAGARNWPWELIVLRAGDAGAMVQTAEALVAALKQGANPEFAELAFALACEADRQTDATVCAAFACRSLQTLAADLHSLLAHLKGGQALPPHIKLARERRANRKIGFMFPGQGAQQVNMACEAALYLEPLRAAMVQAQQVLAPELELPLSRYIWPEAAYTPDEETEQRRRLTDTRVAQPAIGAVSLGYLQLVRNLGISAGAVAGHSYGEYTALHAAGVIDHETFLKLSAIRGRAMARAASNGQGRGGMAAVHASRSQVEARLTEFPGVQVANHNAPEQTVISGPAEAVEKAVAAFEAAGLRASSLPVSGAFHTEHVAAAQAPLSQALASASFRVPQLPVYSNTSGCRHSDKPEQIRALLDRHLLSPVEFVTELEAMYADGVRIFVELGPGSICSRLATATLAGRGDISAIALDGSGGLRGVLAGLAELVVAGASFETARLFAGRGLQQKSVTSLLAERASALAKTAWLLSGGCVRQQTESDHRTGKTVALNLETKANAETAARQTAVAVQNAMPAAPLAAGLPAEALLAYQQTMRQFLALQEKVMGQFLGTGTLPSAMPLSMPAAPVAATVAAAAEFVPPPAAPAARQALDRDAVQKLLLGIVADRTGYPAEMLKIDADLEADLGIDSIKRVEIVGAFRKQLPVAVSEAMKAQIERYTRAKTIDAMLTAIEPHLATAAGPTPPAPSDVVVTALDPEKLLLGIVAERTGYPAEMLKLDADLEADLGIDSIKRVEIIGAFRKQLPPAVSDAMKAQIERYTRAKTLNAILAALTPHLSAQPSAPADDTLPASTVVNPEQLLLGIVAERTGYPVEMLRLDADLEADLGIDSIKRVEIIGAFRKQLPAAVSEAMKAQIERYTRAKTLAAILKQLPVADSVETVATATEAPAPVLIAEAAIPSSRIPRYVMRSVPMPLAGATLPLQGLTLVLGGEMAIVQPLLKDLKSRGLKLVHITETGDKALRAAIDAARKQHGSPRALLDLHGLELNQATTLAEWRSQYRRYLLPLFHAAQHLAAELDGVRILAATRLGGSFGRDAVGSGAPLSGGINGLLNCLRLEYPRSAMRCVDFDGQTQAQIAQLLAIELFADDPQPEAGYIGGERYGAVTTAQPLAENPFQSHAGPASDWVVLATGGARGITADVLHEMARPGMHLVLVGRSAEPAAEDSAISGLETGGLRKALLAQRLARGEKPRPVDIDREVTRQLADREIRANLARLRATGAVIEYVACDVRDEQAFGGLIDGLYRRHDRISAVLHGAGVIEDKLVADKPLESFERVLGTKLDGAFVLSQRLQPETLKLMVFFTSVAGRYGNRGQADYAAANEALNRMAWDLHRRWTGTRVIAVNWGPWAGGMASEAVQRALREKGMEPIPVAAGRRFMAEEIAYGPRHDVELVAGAGPWGLPSAAPSVTEAPSSGPQLRGMPRLAAGGYLVLEQRFSLQSDPWLRDYESKSAQLPEALMLEWMAQFVEAGWPGSQVSELRDLRSYRGISLSDGECRVLLRARASSHSDASGQLAVVEILDPAQQAVYCRATAVLRFEAPGTAPIVAA